MLGLIFGSPAISEGEGPRLTASSSPGNGGTALRIGYLSELPATWRTGLADPLRNIARSLSVGFAPQVDLEYPLPANNLYEAESWDDLAQAITTGRAQLYAMHAYEFIEQERALNLKALVMAKRGHRWQKKFLLLTSRKSGIRSIRQLEGRTILMHRDGCGSLIDCWLDSAVAEGTGLSRQNFARFRTVTQPREAVLPVFFGEADACAVSLVAFQAVSAQNPEQIPPQMELLASSAEFPAHVVVCRQDLPASLQKEVETKALGLTWDFGEEPGGFIVPGAGHFEELRALMGQRAGKSVPGPPAAGAGTSLRPMTAPVPPAPASPATAPGAPPSGGLSSGRPAVTGANSGSVPGGPAATPPAGPPP